MSLVVDLSVGAASGWKKCTLILLAEVNPIARPHYHDPDRAHPHNSGACSIFQKAPGR